MPIRRDFLRLYDIVTDFIGGAIALDNCAYPGREAVGLAKEFKRLLESVARCGTCGVVSVLSGVYRRGWGMWIFPNDDVH